MKVRLLITALLAIQLGLGGILAARWWDGWSSDPVTIIDQPDIQIPEDGGLTLEEAAAVARRQATAWDPAARLVMATAQYDWPLDETVGGQLTLPPGGWLSYVVMAAGEDGENRALAMEIERYTGEVVAAEEIPWPATSAVTLTLAAFPILSEDAIYRAEEAGGTAFRARCPGARAQTIITLNMPPVTMGSAGGLQVAATPEPPDSPALSDPPGLPDPPRIPTTSDANRTGTVAPTSTVPVVMIASPVVTATPAGQASPVATPSIVDIGPANPFWLVTYRDNGADDNLALSVRIDAVTGDVVSVVEDIDGPGSPCGEDV